MYQCGFLLAAILLGGCQDKPSSAGAVELPPNRPVATVYQVSAVSGNVACHRSAATDAPIVTVLREQQLVDLVSAQEGMLQQGGEYWLHVYPRIGHRPACYINVRNLVPVS